MTPVDLVSLIAGAIVLLAWAKRRRLPEAEPPGLTAATPRTQPPALSAPRGGKDGMHRPAALQRRSLGRLVAWSGAVRRAP